MSKSIATLFHCPVSAAKYEVVGFEPRQGRRPIVNCGAFAAVVRRSTLTRASVTRHMAPRSRRRRAPLSDQRPDWWAFFSRLARDDARFFRKNRFSPECCEDKPPLCDGRHVAAARV